ncbi:alpha-amylase family glycosyl hydrolase [Shouchella miscanthi]|uniref:Alpha-amylase n=1 Tax=Shouchella miscanthi TaxID=2598861 RepID=A0ABU6NMA2_9BACI|nr:alpha-amylase family glycosyl hydrolase [Shouchella miscanthi]MED4128370.1 alpha-amylase family glycosyl hydrolase [Shouchella miscanthi]
MEKKRIAWIAPILLVSGCTNVFSGEEEAMKWSQDTPFVEDTESRIYYEIFVRAFADGDGDGIGDLKGATSKLDYLHDLGVTGIWLMPINPSPSYHGYDVTDYTDVHPDYGTIEDMKTFVKEAHNRGIDVIIDFVMNHSSSEHPWFQQALAGDETYRDYYVWSDDSTNLNQVGDWQQPVWHGEGEPKYEGVFWHGMPDMNFANSQVMAEFKEASQFWLEEIGIDGFRLDAAKYLYSAYQLDDHHEENVALWKDFNAHVKGIKPHSMLVGEVWDSASVVGQYLQGIDSGFNFDLSSRILSSVQQEKDTGIAPGLEKVRNHFSSVAEGYVDSTFLTNHDIDRVMSQLNGNEDHAKMAASLLLTLPGNPYLYYGEEVGLEGMKPDEHIREPMIWTKEESPEETTWIERRYSTNREKVAVEAQLENEDSLLHHYREMIAVRRSHPILMDGEVTVSEVKKEGLVAFERVLDEESVLVLHNMTGARVDVQLPEQWVYLYYRNGDSEQNGQSVQMAPYSTVVYSH